MSVHKNIHVCRLVKLVNVVLLKFYYNKYTNIRILTKKCVAYALIERKSNRSPEEASVAK